MLYLNDRLRLCFQVVTCGSTPLESSYQKIPRCVYVSTELHEHKGWSWGSRHAEVFRFFFFLISNSNLIQVFYLNICADHCVYYLFMWQRYVSDFYISDFQSGLRALVKAGYGSKVSPFVVPETVANVTSQTKDLSPSFLQWLADRSLSNDSRAMRLKEGYAFIYTLHLLDWKCDFHLIVNLETSPKL